MPTFPWGVVASLNYQDDSVTRSLNASGKVYTKRDQGGSDAGTVGTSWRQRKVPIVNGRGMNLTLEQDGVELREHLWDHIDYYDNEAVLNTYYPECCELVKQMTGASRVMAFDHNLRSKAPKQGNLKGGNKVQRPALGIHNDYTRFQ